MNKKITRLISLFLILALAFSFAFTGCKKQEHDEAEETQAEQNKTPQALTLKLPYSKNDKINPFEAASMLNQSIAGLVYEGLFSLDQNYKPTANIAAKYSQSGKTLRVTIKKAQFSDGTPIKLSDVLASFNNAKLSAQYKNELSNIKEARIKDNAIEFTLDKPDPNAVNLLTFAITKKGSKEENAIGSGRYVLAKKDQDVFLKVNSKKSDFKPNITEIHLCDVPDIDSLKYTLAIGNISFAFDDLRAGDYSRVSASVKDILMNNMVYVAFNKKSEDLKSEKVRQAISLLINRAEIAQKGFKGYAEATYVPFNPQWDAIKGKDLIIEKDVDAAIKLLEEAGFKADLKAKAPKGDKRKKLTVELLVNKDNNFKIATADLIKEMLSKANITVNITALKESDYKKAVQSGKYDMYLGEIKLTDSMNISSILMEKGSVSYGINTSSKSSKAYEAYLNGSSDIFKFIEVFNEDVPFIPLCFRSGIAAYTRSLKYSNKAHINDIYADIDEWKFD